MDLNRVESLGAIQVGTSRITADFGAAIGTVNRMVEGFLAMLPLIAVALIAFAILLFAAKGARKLAERALARSSNQSAATAISRLLYILMVGLAVLIAVTIAFPTMTPGRLISVLGIGGVAIGFAFKDIFQNLIAGILILLRHPFRVGDEITTGEFTGTVEAIETRATFIRTYDGKRAIIPNSDVYTRPVAVISAYDMLPNMMSGSDMATILVGPSRLRSKRCRASKGFYPNRSQTCWSGNWASHPKIFDCVGGPLRCEWMSSK